jgi:DNA uptake protein ComE-like DNA-binding protein
VDELRMVYGITVDSIYGEDANLNGILDPNENDGETTPPYDNRDGKMDFGFAEYFTVYTSDPNVDTNGNARVSVNNSTNLFAALTNKLSVATSSNVVAAARGTTFSSLAQFYGTVKNVLTVADFESVYDSLCVNTNSPLLGQVNVNTASAGVLVTMPGFTEDMANQLVNYRRSNPSSLKSLAWVAEVLGTNIPPSASNLTTHAYQFTADIAAMGHNGRGYRRVRFVIDTSTGTPQIIYRQDLSHLGWALGRNLREQLQNSKEIR